MTSSQLKDYSQSVNPNLHSTGAESKSLYNTYNVEPLSLTKYAYFEKYANSIKEHYTKEIGEPKHKDPQEYDRSTFTSVIDYIEDLRNAFEKDNQIVSKNLHFINSKIVDLDENSRADLSRFTKDLGNKLLNSYERYSKKINDQRCENLRLQYEIGNLVKEKNSLKHDIKNLTNAVEKLEKYLGITSNIDDCTVKSQRLENAIFENKTKPLLMNK